MVRKRNSGASKPGTKTRVRESRLNAADSPDNGSSASQLDTLRKLYSSLLRCRILQEHLRNLMNSGQLATAYDLAIGREAVTVGATADITPYDTVSASPRNFSALVVRSVPAGELIARNGVDNQKRQQCPEDPFNRGTGIALAHKLEHKKRIVVAFCARQQPPLENWHEALKLAAVHKLPILFVIENGIAGGSASDEAPHLESLSFMARDYNFPGILVDGNDVVAVWRVAQESIHRARNGCGPTLLDCRTDLRQDPLAYMEHYMRKRSAWDDRWREQLAAEVAAEVRELTPRSGTG